MPFGCIGSAVVGTDLVGTGDCTLFGTFNLLNAFTPPAPRTQDVNPRTSAPEKNIT